MRVNIASQRDRQKTDRRRLRKACLVIAGLALLWLASCKPFGMPSSPVNLEPTSTVTSTLESNLTATTPATTNGLPATQTISTSSPGATLIPTATPAPVTSATVQPLAISPLKMDKVGRFELLELDIKSNIVVANPFDPNEINIRVEFTSPTGRIVDVGAFWYQDFDSTGHRRVGEPRWKARFTPTETGVWSAVARSPTRRLESPAVVFHVVEFDWHGFVRVHPSNPRYFAFDDGSFFFPIGLNIAWWSGAGDALTDYRKWMNLFAANGGNTIRVWMAEWSFGIEWNDTPLGDYTNRLRRAWLLDQIFAMAKERDIYVMLVLLNCADFNNWQTNGWNGNPYNKSRGGPLERPEQFVTDSTTRDFLQRRLNYIVNRWGYSTQLLAWEWWNEVNLAPFTDQTLSPWLQEMTAYLRERDVNRHLVTNSYAIRDLSPIWNLPEMDIIQKHEYAHQVKSANKDLAERVAADFKRLARSAPAKPILLGEFGFGTEGYGNDVDRTGIHLHNGIWATTFAGYAGSGMYWYWDVYVETYRVWHHFQGLSRFLEGVDLSQYKPFSPLVINSAGGKPGQAAGLGLRGDDLLVWLRSEAYTVQASIAAWEKAGSPGIYFYNQPLIEDQVLTLRDMSDGVYTVNWFDPQSAMWLNSVEGTAHGGRLSIPIPDFRRDLAARIVPNR
ncbi:MAG: hypothetical protein H6Q37_781 [Chloroflexi bacterium]|nr:hypothetical protein [Chloroflexota bacterium]